MTLPRWFLAGFAAGLGVVVVVFELGRRAS